MITTIYCWTVFSLVTIIFGSVGVILSVLIPSKVHKYAIRPWGYCIVKGFGIEVQAEGLENLPKEPCVVMYNHQSATDIPVFCAFLPIEWKGILKDEVAMIPFVGWVMKLSGHYFVARDGSKRDTVQVKEIVKQIRKGPSAIIAPEGTRSLDGKLLPFKKGGFVIALLARVPVVIMVLSGGKEIMPKGSSMIKPGKMEMKILPPIDVKNLPPGKMGRERLERTVRESMLKALGQEEKIKVAS
ncbi:1-acyl-sn-glycerol-3-phosphate acyltransferase [Desulfobacterota bacterium AH_259_B03_O07]|nr:1-acyl-sn-glycerol-3-phosphate acyltransferase [Desulfobacterota bacterium AH_259_B03_O07]